ncbi:MAG: coenzyme F420-0:L-glutamate ligase [Lautropia sp.]
MLTPRLELIALPGLPAVQAGDDLAALIEAGYARGGIRPSGTDIVVVAQKIVSKAEGRLVDLRALRVSPAATELAQIVRKDARLVELILSESRRVVRAAPDVLIVEHRCGFVMANAGVDQSNIGAPDEGDWALALPLDADASAQRLRVALSQCTGVTPAVVINDSFGRPWRHGTVGIALGAAGLASLVDLRGREDLFARPLRSTQVAHADEVAAAASLLMGQADEGRPVVVVRGVESPAAAECPVKALLRAPQGDLFR